MVATLLVAVILAVQVARLTLAAAFVETRPQLSQTLAPNLPVVLASAAMAQVGEAAAHGRAPPQSAMDRLRRLARVAPLSIEPLLVQAAIAQRSGRAADSERLLLEARRREPRSAAARYLLAEQWLGEGRIAVGLGELAALAHLLPGSSVQLVPTLAQHARSPAAGEQLKRIIAANPRLRVPLLKALAEDPDNLELILDLAGAPTAAPNSGSPAWQAKLLDGLVERGEYERAYALWRRLTGFDGARPPVFNGQFRQVAAPPPFNWSFVSGRAGFSEPQNGSMRVLYYGRENATLAWQLLLLAPGTYRLSADASGTTAQGSLTWTISCLAGGKAIAELELGSSATSASFEVPSTGCPAQRLELKGQAMDSPRESDVQVGAVRVGRLSP